MFIDDIKLFSEEGKIFEDMTKDKESFLNSIGLEINRSKSATNVETYKNQAKKLEEHEGYKYFCILEDSQN